MRTGCPPRPRKANPYYGSSNSIYSEQKWDASHDLISLYGLKPLYQAFVRPSTSSTPGNSADVKPSSAESSANLGRRVPHRDDGLDGGIDLPTRAIREQVASAIDLIIHISRLRDGSRRVTDVTEVQGMEGDLITLQDLFRFDYAAGMAPDGRFLGQCEPTGLRPHFGDRLADVGVPLPSDLFGPVDVIAESRASR